MKIGQKVSYLTVIRIQNSRKIHCKCICDKIVIRPKNYLENCLKHSTRISSCGCKKIENKLGIKSKVYKGYKQISGFTYATIKAQAERRKIPFDLSIQYLGDLLESQNYKCKITNTPINLPLSSKHPECEKTASLDRIDNSKGYIDGNVQWVHKVVNRIRHTNTLEKLYDYCAAIYHTTINTPKGEENA